MCEIYSTTWASSWLKKVQRNIESSILACSLYIIIFSAENWPYVSSFWIVCVLVSYTVMRQINDTVILSGKSKKPNFKLYHQCYSFQSYPNYIVHKYYMAYLSWVKDPFVRALREVAPEMELFLEYYGQYIKIFVIKLINIQSCTFRHFTKKCILKNVSEKTFRRNFLRKFSPNTTLVDMLT